MPSETQNAPEITEETDLEEELALPWKVIVLNDPVNLMNYVVMVFRKVFGYNEQKATLHMREVHELGKSVLWSGDRELAETYAVSYTHLTLPTILLV